MASAIAEAGRCERMAQVDDSLVGGGWHFGFGDIGNMVLLNKVASENGIAKQSTLTNGTFLNVDRLRPLDSERSLSGVNPNTNVGNEGAKSRQNNNGRVSLGLIDMPLCHS